ncbi:7411_t:CDS:2, partial [Gigaspora margarita]
KVEEFRRTKEESHVDDCCQNEIEVRRKGAFEWYMERAEYEDVEVKFDPEGFCYQNGIVAERDERKMLERYPSPAEDKDPDTQDYLGNRSFAIIMLENTCKNWTQKVTTCWCGIIDGVKEVSRKSTYDKLNQGKFPILTNPLVLLSYLRPW